MESLQFRYGGFLWLFRVKEIESMFTLTFCTSSSWRSVFTRTVDGIQFNQSSSRPNFQILDIKNANCALTKGYDGQTLQLVIDESSSKAHHITSSPELIESEKILANSKEAYQLHDLDNALHEEIDSASSFAKSTTGINDKEIERRRKIGLANKGRTPWNKGKTHSEETRECISKKTIEALSDPKVRKKMSEYPRSHNDQSKARISSAMRKKWQERLLQRRLQENCYLKWARSIAEAAKEGYFDQKKLQWDSYEIMKTNIILEYLRWRTEKARAKEIAKLRAEQTAKIREVNALKLAQLREEKEERAKERERKALARKRSVDIKMKIALSKGKLKERLTKFHQHKRQLGIPVRIQREIAVQPQPVIWNLDIDLIKIEKLRRNISFADQIQAVKRRKADSNSNTFAEYASPIYASDEEAGDS